MAYLYLTIAFSLNAAANLLLKLGARQVLSFTPQQPLRFFADNWQLLLGVGFFALNLLFYYLALRSLPVSVAYPTMVVMGFLIVNGYAALVLGESVTTLAYLGYICIVVGLALVLFRTV